MKMAVSWASCGETNVINQHDWEWEFHSTEKKKIWWRLGDGANGIALSTMMIVGG